MFFLTDARSANALIVDVPTADARIIDYSKDDIDAPIADSSTILFCFPQRLSFAIRNKFSNVQAETWCHSSQEPLFGAPTTTTTTTDAFSEGKLDTYVEALKREKNGTRILVFMSVRPLAKKEKEAEKINRGGLTQYQAYFTNEVMALLQQGNKNRTTLPIRANETSSRSYAILQVVVKYLVRDAAMNIINKMSKLSLINRAGSERALATNQRTVRSLEGAYINRSFIAPSSCINAFVKGKKHIPYRSSKVTQLLKDSLGGTCNTIMIVNISPSNLSFGET
ncbi:Kinesin protein KIF18A [Spatholobus suberectus]|nr:Kinesin protein KIF18A [Spatholobus suberectus]